MLVWFSVLLTFQAFSFLESKKEEAHIIQKSAQNLPTFNSLWESNKHYIEAKNNVLFGKLNDLKDNSSVDALQEFDGYLFFQFVHNNLLASSVIVADQLKSHISLGVSTEVCHLDEEGGVSYKLSLVVDKTNQKLKGNGNVHDILLKMYSDSHCSVEFGQYLLDNVEADLRMNDNLLFITTSVDQKLPIPVKGSLFKVVPKDKENGPPPYIFAIENNAPLFNNISNTDTGGVVELSLQLKCSVVDSETKLVTFTTMKNNRPNTIYSRKLPLINDFIYSTSSNRQTLTTSDLFATVMQLIDVSIEKVGKEPLETVPRRNLRGVSQEIVPSIVEDNREDDDRIDATTGSASAENTVVEQLWVVTFECI